MSNYCPIGSLNLHTMNYERTECIWCGPNVLAWKTGRWVSIGEGLRAWSATLEHNEDLGDRVGDIISVVRYAYGYVLIKA